MISRFFHWLGHLLDFDCAITIEHRPGWAKCKRCGREVSILPRAWR